MSKRYFSIGFVCGVIFATAGAALSAQLVGSGYLMGWTVKFKNQMVCDSPYIWPETKEIECD